MIHCLREMTAIASCQNALGFVLFTLTQDLRKCKTGKDLIHRSQTPIASVTRIIDVNYKNPRCKKVGAYGNWGVHPHSVFQTLC